MDENCMPGGIVFKIPHIYCEFASRAQYGTRVVENDMSNIVVMLEPFRLLACSRLVKINCAPEANGEATPRACYSACLCFRIFGVDTRDLITPSIVSHP